MKEHKIWRQTAVLTCANAITRGAGFVLRVVLSRMLGAQAMGVMTLSHSAHMLFITPVTAGLPLAVSRITARHADARALRAGRSLALRASAVLIPLCLIRGRGLKRYAPMGPALRRGLVMGVLTFGAISLQQWGMEYTSASKSGFVTALYIVLVPLLGLFFGKKPGLKVWLADEEFEASGKFYISKSADCYLTMEDAVTVGEILLSKLNADKHSPRFKCAER